MHCILHQHYESVLRLSKLVNHKQLYKFYGIFNDNKFLKLAPQARLELLQKSMPIPDNKYFSLENFNEIARQTVEEMVQYNIIHIDLRVSLHFERWQDVGDIRQAKKRYDKAITDYDDKSISFIRS